MSSYTDYTASNDIMTCGDEVWQHNSGSQLCRSLPGRSENKHSKLTWKQPLSQPKFEHGNPLMQARSVRYCFR